MSLYLSCALRRSRTGHPGLGSGRRGNLSDHRGWGSGRLRGCYRGWSRRLGRGRCGRNRRPGGRRGRRDDRRLRLRRDRGNRHVCDLNLRRGLRRRNGGRFGVLRRLERRLFGGLRNGRCSRLRQRRRGLRRCARHDLREFPRLRGYRLGTRRGRLRMRYRCDTRRIALRRRELHRSRLRGNDGRARFHRYKGPADDALGCAFFR